LCVYNNAQFTKEDWQGIQMINSSVKEFDPVKIGRFGLGFILFHGKDGTVFLKAVPHCPFYLFWISHARKESS
jgi:sacsin